MSINITSDNGAERHAVVGEVLLRYSWEGTVSGLSS